MQSLRKLGFQNEDTKKHGPVEIWAGRLNSPAAASWIPFFIKISFNLWPLLSHHESVFYPTPFQGFPHSREPQTQQPVINFTCDSTVLIELRFWLKWFLSEQITAQKRAIGCPVPTHRRSERYQWSCSESFQSLISEEKGFWVSLRI